MATRIETKLRKENLINEDLATFEFSTNSIEIRPVELDCDDYDHSNWDIDDWDMWDDIIEEHEKDYNRLCSEISDKLGWGGYLTGYGSWVYSKGYDSFPVMLDQLGLGAYD